MLPRYNLHPGFYIIYNSMIICLCSAFVLMTHMTRGRLIWDTLHSFLGFFFKVLKQCPNYCEKSQRPRCEHLLQEHCCCSVLCRLSGLTGTLLYIKKMSCFVFYSESTEPDSGVHNCDSVVYINTCSC